MNRFGAGLAVGSGAGQIGRGRRGGDRRRRRMGGIREREAGIKNNRWHSRN